MTDGITAALTAGLPEQTRREGRASERTHRTRTRAAMLGRIAGGSAARRAGVIEAKGSTVRMRTTQGRVYFLDFYQLVCALKCAIHSIKHE